MSLPSAGAASTASTPPAPRVRATTADRDHAASLIETSVADGSLTPDEGQQRSHAVRAAVHRDEFASLLADLPVAQAPPPELTRRGSGPVSSLRSFVARRRVLSLVIAIILVVAVLGGGVAAGFEWFDGGHGAAGTTHEMFHQHPDH